MTAPGAARLKVFKSHGRAESHRAVAASTVASEVQACHSPCLDPM